MKKINRESSEMKIRLSSAGLALALAASIGLWACQSKEVTSAKVYIQQGDWNKAIEQLQIAVQTYPNDPEAHYLLGRGYAEKGMYKERAVRSISGDFR
jgi:Flp pilus assembly protein TadD